MQERPIAWQALIESFFRRKKIVVFSVLAGILLSIGLVLLSPPMYRAKARVLLSADAVSGPREAAMNERQVQAELALLTSETLIRGVLEDFQGAGQAASETPASTSETADSGGFLGKFLRSGFGNSGGSDLGGLVTSVEKRLAASQVGNTNVVEVSLVDKDGEWAARLVNGLINQHVERIAELSERSEEMEFLGGQRGLLQERWMNAEKALAAFKEGLGEDLLAGDESQMEDVLRELRTKKVDAETEVLELTAKVAFLEDELSKSSTTISAESRLGEDESVSFLRERLLEMEIQRSESLSRYTPSSTVVKDLDRRIEEASKLLAEKENEQFSEVTTAFNPLYQALEVELLQAKAGLAAAEVRRRALESQIAPYRQQLAQVEGASGELADLEDQVQSAREAYQLYTREEERTRFSNAQDQSRIVNVSIIERAAIPSRPEPNKNTQAVIVILFSSFVLGLAGALVVDSLDSTLKSSSEITKLSGLPIVAEIPHH